LTDYDEIKSALKDHQLSIAEAIINSKLDNFSVSLRDYQFARFYKNTIVIYFNLWKLILEFDNNGNLIDEHVEDLAVSVSYDD
jgi:hypothetical protein